MSYRLYGRAIVASVVISAIAGCMSGPPASNAGGAQSGSGAPQAGGIAASVQRDGEHVTFSWQPVSGAAAYTVFVFDKPDGPPLWMWWGTETRVVFGGAPLIWLSLVK